MLSLFVASQLLSGLGGVEVKCRFTCGRNAVYSNKPTPHALAWRSLVRIQQLASLAHIYLAPQKFPLIDTLVIAESSNQAWTSRPLAALASFEKLNSGQTSLTRFRAPRALIDCIRWFIFGTA